MRQAAHERRWVPDGGDRLLSCEVACLHSWRVVRFRLILPSARKRRIRYRGWRTGVGEGAFVLADHDRVDRPRRSGYFGHELGGLWPSAPRDAVGGAGVEVGGDDLASTGDQAVGHVVLPSL